MPTAISYGLSRTQRVMVGSVGALLMLVGLSMIGLWLTALIVTAPGPQAHGIWRASVPGLDLGVDAYPAEPGAVGYVNVWVFPTDPNFEGADVWTVLRVKGRGALPLLRLPRGYQYV